MRHPASSVLPFYEPKSHPATEPATLSSTGTARAGRWSTRKWLLLFYVVLGVYAAAVLGVFVIGWTPLSAAHKSQQQQETKQQHSLQQNRQNALVVDPIKMETTVKMELNEIEEDWSEQEPHEGEVNQEVAIRGLKLKQEPRHAREDKDIGAAPEEVIEPVGTEKTVAVSVTTAPLTLPPTSLSVISAEYSGTTTNPETNPPNPSYPQVLLMSKYIPGNDAALLSNLRNNAADREFWTVEEYQHELDRLEGTKREVNQDIERLQRLVDAANKLIAEETERLEDKRATSILSLRLHQPRKIRNNLKCLGWRRTRQCDPYGKRAPSSDLACNQLARGGVSGFCEVLDEDTGEAFRVMELNCSSLHNRVKFSCAMAADIANFGRMTQGVYENALAQNTSDPSNLLGNNGSGNGIVMVVSPKLLPSVFATISVLRSYNCTLPIELWISQRDVVRASIMGTVLGMWQQRFSNVTVETIGDPTVTGFTTKIHAIQHSKFENVLFLDADNVPVRDPTFLFESQEYREHGAIFWPDFWHPDKNGFNVHRESLLWELVDLPFVDMFEQESGQILINRKRAAIAFEVLMFFMYHRPNHFDQLMLVHGDKDLFRLAWMKTQTPFYMMPFPPGAAGTERGTDQKRFCGMTMVQFDVDGNVLFLHRNAKKLKGNVKELDPKYWTHLQTFKWERKMAIGDRGDTVFPINGTAVQRMRSYQEIKQKYQIRWRPSGFLFKEFAACFGAHPDFMDNFDLTRFEDYSFANLEQELIDYAHEAALLMAQV